MILSLAVIIGLAATIIRARVMKRSLILPSLHQEWLVFIAVIPQIIIFYIPSLAKVVPEKTVPYIQILSMIGLIVFVGLNIINSGFVLLGVGLVSNFLAIATNGGWMPISVKTLTRLHPEITAESWKVGQRLLLTKDRIQFPERTNLAFLTDTLNLPAWISYKFAFSVGDILISIGMISILWSLSNPIKE
jgi:hypothetical protein